MPNHRPVLVLLALAAGLGAGACTGSGDVSRDSVEERVTEYLVDRGEDDGVAEDVAECVADAIFDDSTDDSFTREERNDIGKGVADTPDPDLVARVEAIVNDCERGGGRDGEADSSAEG